MVISWKASLCFCTTDLAKLCASVSSTRLCGTKGHSILGGAGRSRARNSHSCSNSGPQLGQQLSSSLVNVVLFNAFEEFTFAFANQMATDEGLMGTEKEERLADTAPLKNAIPTWFPSLFLISQVCPDLTVILPLLNTLLQYLVSINPGKSYSDQLLDLQRVSSLEDQV
ncbi:hypothetical protein MPH_10149 [Macrophomina phaseolina MS6]|uniref:Uncharacterized protein n=1 Tax=Macrophomina phaseolina (strain MS6) TaxID=1126212 RepID=K2QS62_MACPH|nr:hypothetical protein MPH_10149 [Macrophomina phaseolina MS6]